jgi:hypothetical protein
MTMLAMQIRQRATRQCPSWVVCPAQDGHAFADNDRSIIAEIAGGTFRQLVASSLIMLLILIPFFTFRSPGEVIGDRTPGQLYFEPASH